MDSSSIGKVALFWDESFLWGLIAYDTFTQLSINFGLITSADIQEGILEKYDTLFVPGGWASNKAKALGERGKESIRRFVELGGSYLGFCGGAGLALEHKDGISLVPVTRKPTSDRIPSFSGKIKLNQDEPNHPIWSGIPNKAAFHAWWPGQFSILEHGNVKVLASYDVPGDGSYVADLPVGPTMNWDQWEKSYGTNLNPERIKGEPAVLETDYGKGKVLLSYLHFETPDDNQGQKVLLNIFEYLADKKVQLGQNTASKDEWVTVSNGSGIDKILVETINDLEAAASDLISFGQHNFLWYWRNPWIIQWRRGVRGTEYCTVYSMLKRLALLAPQFSDDSDLIKKTADLKEFSLPFFEKARQLLTLERFAMNRGPISPLKSNDENIRRMREELFSNSKSFGGYFKQIIDRIDAILLPMLKKLLP